MADPIDAIRARRLQLCCGLLGHVVALYAVHTLPPTPLLASVCSDLQADVLHMCRAIDTAGRDIDTLTATRLLDGVDGSCTLALATAGPPDPCDTWTVCDPMGRDDTTAVGSVNMSKYMYDRKKVFREHLMALQGWCRTALPADLFDFVRTSLAMHGIALADATQQHVRDVLSTHTRYKQHLLYVPHIHATVTGQPPLNISHIERTLLDDFTAFINAYYTRSACSTPRGFVSVKYILFQLLYKHGVHVDADFGFRSANKRVMHERVVTDIFVEFGWPCKVT